MLGLAGALSVGLAACAGGAGDATGPSSIRPSGPTATGATVPDSTTTSLQTIGPLACDLLTADEVGAVVGFTPVTTAYSAPSILAGGYTSNCDYSRSAGGPGAPGAAGAEGARVIVFPPGTPFDSLRTRLGEPHTLTVPGVTVLAGRAGGQPGSGPNLVAVVNEHAGFTIAFTTDRAITDDQLTELARTASRRFDEQGGRTATQPGQRTAPSR